MKEDVEILKSKFEIIKSLGLVKAMRKGPTGVGYTFECLIGKVEDQECKPDFKSIEIKCLLGYSKSVITLFSAAPLRNGKTSIKYIYDNYSYYRYGNKNDLKIFERKVFSKYALELYNWSFKLSVNYYEQVIKLSAFNNGDFIETVCSWDFTTIERKLKKKLTNLAVVEAYPYRKQNIIYFKYVKINFYKLKGFFEFLKLIENDKIFVNFYVKEKDSSNSLGFEDHGVKFRIKREHLEDLFYKLK